MGGTLLAAILFGEATAAFEIIYILRGGMLLEEYIATKSKNEIHKLVELDVQEVYVLREGVEMEIPIEKLSYNDHVVCRSGEKIPVDGVIVSGSAEINEAVINGRSEPQYRQEEESVFAGTVCEKGRIVIEAKAVGKGTYAIMANSSRLALRNPNKGEA